MPTWTSSRYPDPTAADLSSTEGCGPGPGDVGPLDAACTRARDRSHEPSEPLHPALDAPEHSGVGRLGLRHRVTVRQDRGGQLVQRGVQGPARTFPPRLDGVPTVARLAARPVGLQLAGGG